MATYNDRKNQQHKDFTRKVIATSTMLVINGLYDDVINVVMDYVGDFNQTTDGLVNKTIFQWCYWYKRPVNNGYRPPRRTSVIYCKCCQKVFKGTHIRALANHKNTDRHKTKLAIYNNGLITPLTDTAIQDKARKKTRGVIDSYYGYNYYTMDNIINFK